MTKRVGRLAGLAPDHVLNLEGHLFEACGSNGRLKPTSMFVYHQSCAEGILSVKA